MSINRVTLVGNVGKDPEVCYFDNGGSVANFTLATTERGYTAANGTQVPERTEWHNIVVWRWLAETVEKSVKKGTRLFIEGKIRTRSYDDANGNKRYITEIWGDSLEVIERKSDGNRAPFPEPPAYAAATTSSAPAAAPATAQQAAPAPQSSTSEPTPEGDGKDDDLPF